ncbi:MAG: alkylated DNA repair dioxygenase AlkB [Patiriisocius sp.]|jgi:alkylated DNA repair dioxygenase AlkB
MSLFQFNAERNLIPEGGIVNYHGKIMSDSEAQSQYDSLIKNVLWKNDEAMMFGKHIITKRKVAWYADTAYEYTYSKITKNALPWIEDLKTLKSMVEKITRSTYNSCLLNLYHDGSEGMAYHSDDEKTLGDESTIASLSFGAERKFLFKHKRTKETVGLFLEAGSLLVMRGATQKNWLHRLPPTKKINSPRINLTFRTIVM